jgi:hypothetical protein
MNNPSTNLPETPFSPLVSYIDNKPNPNLPERPFSNLVTYKDNKPSTNLPERPFSHLVSYIDNNPRPERPFSHLVTYIDNKPSPNLPERPFSPLVTYMEQATYMEPVYENLPDPPLQHNSIIIANSLVTCDKKILINRFIFLLFILSVTFIIYDYNEVIAYYLNKLG